MDLDRGNRQWLKDVPYVASRFAIREVKEKLRVLTAIAGYLDDFADVENNLGKALTKINCHPAARTELLPQMASATDTILKGCVQLNSRNHISYASTISQSVGKPMPDYSKGNVAKVNNIVSRVRDSTLLV
jgi:hypothetical protein